ncbi:MAG: MATE family efflux transporter [Clostridia bacterium]|nr:MATE family efflux transporter [Clostridia bacterium]
MQIQLSDHFTFKKLFIFVLPSILMMIFTSIYSVVDGFFVSNFVGKQEFAALNLIFPFIMIIGSFGFMMGTGGSAIVAKTLGEGDAESANGYFSFLCIATVVGGTALSVLGIVFIRPISILLGAEGKIVDYCVIYGTIMISAMPAFMLQNMFQAFFVAAEKPKIGLIVTLIAGCTNIVGDALLVGVFRFGLVGAAIASALGQLIGGIVPLFYFTRKNNSLLRLNKPKAQWSVLFKTCTNGSSELMSNISMSLVNMLYNYQLYRIAGEDGISAYGVIMYVNFIFVAIFIGYSIGCAPLVSYNHGAKNHAELKNLYKKSILSMLITGALMTTLALSLSTPLSMIFVGYDASLTEMTAIGFRFFSACFLFSGINIFASSFFTALNNGLISAILSFIRTLVFQIASVMLLPLLISPEINGVWISVVVAEILAFALSAIFLFAMRKKYNYA